MEDEKVVLARAVAQREAEKDKNLKSHIEAIQINLRDLNVLRGIWKADPSLETQNNYLDYRRSFKTSRYNKELGHVFEFSYEEKSYKVWSTGYEVK